MDEKKQLIMNLNEIIEKYKNYFIGVINQVNGIYTKGILINTILQRSISIIDAYKKILNSNNIFVLNSLMRMQIDNCIFIYGIHMLVSNGEKITTLYGEILNGKKLSDYSIYNKKLYDSYIIKQINKDFPKIKELYEFCCRNIHYSQTASFLSMEAKEENIIEFTLSTNYNRFENQCIINGKSFVEISKLVLITIEKYWKRIEHGNKFA